MRVFCKKFRRKFRQNLGIIFTKLCRVLYYFVRIDFDSFDHKPRRTNIS